MRIAIVTHDIVKGDGQGRVNLELAGFLSRRGHTVHLYANRIDRDLLGMNNIVYHHIPVFIQRPDLIKGIVFLLIATLWLLLKRHDIVHLNGAVSLAPYAVNTCHFCHSSWASASRKLPSAKGIRRPYYFVYTWLNAWLERLIYKRGKGLLVAVSRKVKAEILHRAKVRNKEIVVIHNGVDLSEFSPRDRSSDRQWLVLEFGLSPSDLIAVFAGDVRTERKGLDYLLRALSGLKGTQVTLLVAGDRRSSPFVKKLELYGLGDMVKFIGYRSDLNRVLKGADALVLPTLYDPFGAVVLEAMASGLAVLVSNASLCGASELIEDEKEGILLDDPTDPQEIEEGLRLLLSSSGSRKALGTRARETAEENSWTDMAQRYEAVYCKCLNKRPGKRGQEGADCLL